MIVSWLYHDGRILMALRDRYHEDSSTLLPIHQCRGKNFLENNLVFKIISPFLFLFYPYSLWSHFPFDMSRIFPLFHFCLLNCIGFFIWADHRGIEHFLKIECISCIFIFTVVVLACWYLAHYYSRTSSATGLEREKLWPHFLFILDSLFIRVFNCHKLRRKW